jgi:ubiquinone/menaquinone biosynthesis C-methylase UbiE
MKGRGTYLGGSLSFDLAADIYDGTRNDPDEVSAKLTEALQRELAAAGADHLLEIGIGTGRISRPLMERGVQVTGIDIAPRMMAKLREQLSPVHTPPHLLLADATALPFASRAFRAVLTVHVLHLVSSWQGTLDEVRRVLPPGGVFIHHSQHHKPDVWSPSAEKWNEMLTRRGYTRRARPSPEQIADKLESIGASRRTKVYAEAEERTTASFVLEQTRDRINSWSWEVPDDLFAECLPEYEAFMREHYGGLDREFVQRATFELDIWTFP